MKTILSRLARAVDPGLIAALAFAIAAAWPFLSRPSLPLFTDAELHIYRAGEIIFSLREGILWPRWAPDFYYGYGYPVFNYYAPLTYHIASYYALLTGTDVVAGTKAVFVLAIGLGAVGVYGFVRDRWGASAGVLASAALTFSPYVLYIDPHARGDSPELFAIGLAPLMFWLFDRLYRSGRSAAWVAATLTLAAMILTHPLMALVFFGLLVAWLAWAMLIVPLAPNGMAPPPRRHVWLVGLALLIGIGLAALYWMPVLLERSAIQLHNVAGPGYFDFHRYFIGLGELASPSKIFDLGATQPDFNFNIGWPQVFLAALGALTAFTARTRRIDLLFFVFTGLGFIYLMTRASLQVWESIPQMSFFQFPTRFLGPASFALAVLAGASLRWLNLFDRPWLETAAAVALATGCLVGAAPLMYPPGWGDFGVITPQRMINEELNGRALGTTSSGDFLPVGVVYVPNPEMAYINSYYSRPVINKLNAPTVPGFAGVEVRAHGATYDRFLTGATRPFVLQLFTFYFPGWKAYVDGQEVPIVVEAPHGFITFKVPIGPHDVEVRFTDTPSRTAGHAVSTLSLIALIAIAIRRRREGQTTTAGAPLSRPIALGLAAAVVVFAAFKMSADASGWFR
ncbi:MAG: glycosyltransferase family 39 protein, partial [Chloroflexi bacterium]|nr:glycosyltransferase family 39 protein [Chloroflexota bacterium]